MIARGRDAAPPAEDSARRLLHERARKHARAAAGSGGTADIDVLVCRLGDEYFAIELPRLRAVSRAGQLTPVPCTPPHVAGLLNVRGEIAVVLDLAVVLGLPGAAQSSDQAHVVLIEWSGDLVGLLVDDAPEVERLSHENLDQPLSEQSYARGVADARITLLDLERTLSDARLEVFQEVN